MILGEQPLQKSLRRCLVDAHSQPSHLSVHIVVRRRNAGFFQLLIMKRFRYLLQRGITEMDFGCGQPEIMEITQ
jgi:hypothetical protein